jgi:haloacid dehalogenase superfamily, subfamily IA, variant 3 with third motif having DD or ED
MARITTLFWDIGGVVLTNGWDRKSRKEAGEAFHLDWDDFQDRHELSFPAFDAGQLSLNDYLDRTLFYRPRKFTREEFTAFMFAQSKEFPAVRAILDRCVASNRYFVGAINNEPLELNQYRIEAFNLRRSFQVFFSSCYIHSRKPEEGIFRVALAVTQRRPEECVFIDDRPLNLEAPRRLGMSAIHYQSPDQLHADLSGLQVEV